MGWRASLRKALNREDHLAGWRLALMRLVDPVEWYMRSHDEGDVRPSPRRHRHPGQQGWTMYAPLNDLASDLERHQVRLEETRRRREAAQRTRDALDRQASFFEVKARELLDRDSVRIDAGDGWVEARLVRFRNGAVLEHRATSSEGTGSGMARIEQRQLANPIPVLAGHLRNAVLGLGPEPDPLR